MRHQVGKFVLGAITVLAPFGFLLLIDSWFDTVDSLA